jgi:hypothetical protein
MASPPASDRTNQLRDRTVDDVHATEMMELLDACGALHRDGMLDREEYDAKCMVLAQRAANARRVRQP